MNQIRTICEITKAGIFIGIIPLADNQITTTAPEIPAGHIAKWTGTEWAYIPAIKPVCQLDDQNCYCGVTNADLDMLEPETSYLIPAGCVDSEPPSIKAGFAAMWVDEAWSMVEDHRGKIVYDIRTGAEHMMDLVGSIVEPYTSTPRPDQYHEWVDGKWAMTEASEQQKQADNAAEQMRKVPALLIEAAQRISEYQDMFDFADNADEMELAESGLSTWRQYRATLLKFQKGLLDTLPNKPE